MAINQEYYGFTPTKYVTTGAAGGGVGSAGDPWTLAEAMTSAVAGDIVAIAAGVYVGSSTNNKEQPAFRPSNSGTSGSPIRFVAQWAAATHTTDLTDIRCGNTDAVANRGCPAFGTNNVDYIEWVGILSDNNDSNNATRSANSTVGIWLSDYINVYGCKLIGNQAQTGNDNYSGFRIEDSDYSEIHNNSISGYTGRTNHTAVMTYGNQFTQVYNNEIFDCQHALQPKGSSRTDSDNIIGFDVYKNKVYNCVHFMRIHGLVKGPSSELNKIYQNVVYDCDYIFEFTSSGTTVGSPDGLRAFNNVFYNTDARQGTMFTSDNYDWTVDGTNPRDSEFFNNILSSATASPAYVGGDHTFTDIGFYSDIINPDRNVVHNFTKIINAESGANLDSTTWGEWQSAGNDVNSTQSDPLFASPATQDFTLVGGSPASNLGRDREGQFGTVDATIPAGVYVTGSEVIGIGIAWSAATNTAGTSVTITLNEAYTTTTAAYTDFTIAGHTITTGTGLQLTSGTSFTLTVDDAIGSHETLVVTYDGTGDFTADSDSSVIAAGDIDLVNNSTVDQVAPVLTTPVGIQTGTTTASGTVTTDEGNGTLYWEVTASATPPASGPVATITSKQDLPSEYGETTDPLGVSFSTTTDGSGSGATLTCTARTFDAGMQLYRVDQFTLNAGGTGYQVGDSLVMQLNFPPFGDYPSCTVATTSPNATFISDATSAGNTQTVSATGSQIVSVTGLSAATSYYIHFLHVDAASNESNVSTSAQFTTQALTAPTLEQGIMNPDLPVINSAGSTLTLTFSEAVTTSAATGLTLSTGETLTYSSGSTTDTIVYTISPYAQAGGGGEILNFAGGANVIEATVGGTDVEAFSDVLVSSQSTATAPVVVGDPTVDETGTVLTVVFSSASLANQTTPAYSPFTLTGTLGGVYTFTNASIPANTGVFTVSPAVEYNDVLSLSFTQAGGTFTDGTTGIELATFTDTVVNNTSATDNEPPIFTSDPAVSKTTVQGHSIRQTINETGNVYGVMVAAGTALHPPLAKLKQEQTNKVSSTSRLRV